MSGPSLPPPAVSRLRELAPADLHDDVRPVEPSAYDASAAAFAEALRVQPGAVAVARYGSAGCPGVSDLDLLVVCEDAAYGETVAATEEARSRLDAGYPLLVHQVFVLPRSVAPLRSVLHFPDADVAWETLAGDASVLAGLPVDHGADALGSLVWGSTIWRIAAHLDLWLTGVRRALLLARTVAHQCRRDLRLRRGDAPPPPDDRAAILALPSAERGPAALSLLLGAFAEWESFLREHVEGDCMPPWGSRALPLPGAYRRLAEVLGGEFPLGKDAIPGASGAYLDAVREAKKWGERWAGDPWTLFLHGGRGIFPPPFSVLEEGVTAATARSR